MNECMYVSMHMRQYFGSVIVVNMYVCMYVCMYV